jgi:hypothetical protein
MKKVPLVWAKLREWNGSLQTAFETLCNHFAAYETVPHGSTFVPVGPPDGGVESYWIFPDETEWGFQAKFFTAKPESSEWSQIDKSIQRALETHPLLTRYTVCLPIDRADPRKEDKEYFKDAWDTHQEKWVGWAKKKGRTVQFDYWGETELSERFAQERHAGRYYFWFHSELFSEAWFGYQLNRAKENAGARYTPELNVDLPIARVFDGLYRTKAFFQGIGKLQNEVRKHSRFGVTEADTFAKAEIDKINAATNSVHQHLERALQTSNDQPVAMQGLIDAAEAGRLAAEELSRALSRFEENKRKEISEKYGEEELHKRHAMQSMYDDHRFHLRYLINSLYELSSFCESSEGMAANAPALLISGAGGCGKTHLLCDVAFRQHKNGAPAVLLLGQQFDTTNPWSQVLDQLGVDCTRDEFLSALELAGQLRGTFAMFAIDALNEGDGKQLWNKHLAGFLADLRRFPGIKTTLSVRSTYYDVCIPKHVSAQQLLSAYHRGFTNHEYKATETFFAHYKIKRPSIPMLVPEFQSPLFLKVFCQALQNRGMAEIPPGLHGISSVFDFFVESVDEKLSGPDYLDCDPHAHVVAKAIDVLADLMAERGRNYLERSQAMSALNAILPYSGYQKSLLNHMISESVLGEDRRPGDGPSHDFTEVIHFAYERFTDHLITKRLIDKHVDDKNPGAAFETGGPLHQFIEDEHAARMNNGLLEALCVQIPERLQREFPDIVGAQREWWAIRSAFLNSLAVRAGDAFSEKTLAYVNEVILRYRNGWESLLDTLLQVATNPAHPYNAWLLHAKLLSLSLPQRDHNWTIYLCEHHATQGPVDRLMDWAVSPDDKSYLDDQSRILCGVALAWFLTSSNRRQRDLATKGLVRLFTDHLPLLINVINNFGDVDDPYVSERLYCVAYGCALRGHDDNALKLLAEFVYSKIFKNQAPPANILLRDYARGVVEFTLHRKVPLRIVKRRIRPTYKSAWSDDIPTMEEFDKQYGYSRDKSDTIRTDWYSIYGSVLSGGDFERYVIGTNSGQFEWSSRRIGEPMVSRGSGKDKDIFDLSIAQRWIFNRVVELGWTPALFAKFDVEVNRSHFDRRADKAERIGKKYQWIAYYEFLARVSDNFQYLGDRWDASDRKYAGPWQAGYVRNIDPSCLLTTDHGDEKFSAWWSPTHHHPSRDLSEVKWIRLTTDLPAIEPMLKVQRPSDHSNWLVLESHRSFDEPIPLGEDRFDSPFKQLWYIFRSYLVRKGDAAQLIASLEGKNFWGRWMPESGEEWHVLQGEFYWSPAYIAHDTPYYNHNAWTKGDRGQRLIKKVCVTTEGYLKERGYDCSIEDAIHLKLPAKMIAEGMSLRWSGKDGVFCDAAGKEIAFDPTAKETGPGALLVRQEEFQQYLLDNDLEFFWTVLGAKQGMHGHMSRETWNGELQISGVFRLVNGEIAGNFTTVLIDRP